MLSSGYHTNTLFFSINTFFGNIVEEKFNQNIWTSTIDESISVIALMILA
jgi:hypothetical protein